MMFADPSPASYDEATDVVIAPSGDILVAGYEGGRFGVSSVDPGGDSVGVIHSFRDTGRALVRGRESLFLGKDNGSAEVVEALAVRDDGGEGELGFAGRTTGVLPSGDPECGPSPINAGQYDLVVGWLASAGDSRPQCLLQSGTSRPQHPRHIALAGEAQLVIAGYDDIYVPTNYVEAWENPFVTRARRVGSRIEQVDGWPLVYDTVAPDVIHGMAAGPQADAPVYFTTSTSSGTNRGVALVKLGADQRVEWTSVVSRIGSDLGAAVHRLPNGDVLLVGTTFAQLGDGSFGDQDVFIQRVTPDNQLRWTRQYGTDRSDLATDVAVAADGTIYILGETVGSFLPERREDTLEADVFVLRLDSEGATPAAFQLLTPGDERATAIAVSADKRVYVVGSTTGAMFGNEHRGERDGFVLRVLDTAIDRAVASGD